VNVKCKGEVVKKTDTTPITEHPVLDTSVVVHSRTRPSIVAADDDKHEISVLYTHM